MKILVPVKRTASLDDEFEMRDDGRDVDVRGQHLAARLGVGIRPDQLGAPGQDRLQRHSVIRPGADDRPVAGARQREWIAARAHQVGTAEAGPVRAGRAQDGRDAPIDAGDAGRTVAGSVISGVRGSEICVPSERREVKRHQIPW